MSRTATEPAASSHGPDAPASRRAQEGVTWVQRAEATLSAAGHKRGGARRAVLELLDRQSCALTAVEIEDALRNGAPHEDAPHEDAPHEDAPHEDALQDGAPHEDVPREDTPRTGRRRPVSRASVYRILDELERLRLVQRVETGQAMVRYERVHEHSGHHHHLVCDSCGLVMPFADEALERAIDELSAKVPLAVSEHEIVLHGACRECVEG
jgi:Fur family transcriptional regulator, ferric uptake regulator